MPEQPKERTTSVKSTNTARKIRGMVKTMYSRAHEAKAQGRPVAYCMLGCVYDEILLAMDITPIWTENYAGLCATKRDAERFLFRAESDGYSNCVCSYVRTGLGFEAMRRELGSIPPDAPDGGMAQPNMMLGCSYGCDPRFKWYQSMGHYLDTPVYSHDVLIPSIDADLKEIAPYHIKYQVDQLKGLISFLEQQTGKRMDYNRLSHFLTVSNETHRTWWEVNQLRKAVPSPMPSQDHFNVFVPGVFRLGEQETLDFYRELYAEVKERVDKGIGVIDDEKYRLMWGGGLPPWHTMWMFNHFETMGAVFAIENAYFHWEPWEMPVGVDKPLEFLAWKSFHQLTQNYEEAQKGSGNPTVERLLKLVREYKIDGMLMHSTRSCRAATIGQMHMNAMIQKHMTVPVLQLTSDMVDLRDYSEAQWRMQINAFMETVAARKSGRSQA